MSLTAAAPLRIVKRTRAATTMAPAPVTLRTAQIGDADAIHALIVDYLAEGHLLPRTIEEIRLHVERFVIAIENDRIVACGELAPLSRAVAEVRSLVVSRDGRSQGLGSRIVEELVARAERSAFDKLCAFTHSPAYFVQLGFSIVPHVWLPEKILADCHCCAHFRHCGQYAVVRALARSRPARVPRAALHG